MNWICVMTNICFENYFRLFSQLVFDWNFYVNITNLVIYTHTQTHTYIQTYIYCFIMENDLINI